MVCGFVLFGLAFEYFRNKEEKKEMKRRNSFVQIARIAGTKITEGRI